MIKVVTVVGARPQFIKAAVVSRCMSASNGIKEILLHTGQHYDENMSEIFFEEMDIPKPSYNLGIGSGAHGAQTGQMLKAIEDVLLVEHPDWVLVYGDTNSTLAAALAACKLHIPVAHVEAGLRSFNRRMPEEVNRVLTDHSSSLLFPPTDTATLNLRREGISGANVVQAGDVMYDAALYYGERVAKKSRILERLGVAEGRYILATVHRAENTDSFERMSSILSAFVEVASDIPVILPLHPRTRAVLARSFGGVLSFNNLQIIDPVGYLDMVMLEKCAGLIVTDSGGVQKEAFFHQTPCVTLRDETEWVELVELGWNRLISPLAGGLAEFILSAVGSRGRGGAPYGDGSAGQSIVQELMRSSWG